MGAVAQPWVNLDRWTQVLGWNSVGDACKKLHAYVSADPSVKVTGSPSPRALAVGAKWRGVDRSERTVGAIRRAAALALRQPVGERYLSVDQKRLALFLAAALTPLRPAQAGRALGISQQTASRILRGSRPTPREWNAALMILGDRRMISENE
jgi:hypothetical protein